MRIALAQLNPTSGDINGNTAKILAALESARAAGRRPDRHAGNGAARLLHRRSGRGRRVPRRQRAGDAARLRTPRAASPRSSGFIDFDPAARNESGAIRKYNAAGGRARRRGPAARAQDAASELPLLRRQAVFRAGRRARTGHRPGRGGHRFGSASRSAKISGTSSTTIKPLAELAAKGRGRAPQPERVAVLSGQASRARRDHPAAPRGSCASRSSTSTRPAPPTTARTSSRSTARAWSTTRAGRLIAIGRQFEEQLLVVDLDPARHRRPAVHAAADRRAIARCTTGW